MKLKIKIENQSVQALLISGNKTIDQETADDFSNLSGELLPAISRILKRNELTLADIKKIDSEIDLPESYTASRIVRAIVKGLKLRMTQD